MKFLRPALAIAALLMALFASSIFAPATYAATHNAQKANAVNKSVTHCLGAAAFPLNDLCVTTNYTVYSSTNEQISSVKGCVDVQGPAAYASLSTQVDVYNQGPKVWSQNNQSLQFGPVGTESEKCVWYWPWKSVQPGNTGVWFGVGGPICTNVLHPDQCNIGDPSSETIVSEWVDNSNFS
jgi:hypothetical protein